MFHKQCLAAYNSLVEQYANAEKFYNFDLITQFWIGSIFHGSNV